MTSTFQARVGRGGKVLWSITRSAKPIPIGQIAAAALLIILHGGISLNVISRMTPIFNQALILAQGTRDRNSIS